jgi:hypothetical protein
MTPRQIVAKAGAGVMLGLVAVGVCSSGCSDPAATSSAAADDTVRTNDHDHMAAHRLWKIAERAAEGMGGSVKSAQAVKSRHAVAEATISGDVVPGNQRVWTIQVEGVDEFVCRSCTYPAGATPPTGRFLTVVVDAKTFATTDGGLGSAKVDLSSLGTVIDLDDPAAS